MHVQTCAHMHCRAHTLLNTQTHVHTPHMTAHTHTRVCTHAHSCTDTHTHTCTPMHMHTHTCTLTHIHAQRHSHTHTCTHSPHPCPTHFPFIQQQHSLEFLLPAWTGLRDLLSSFRVPCLPLAPHPLAQPQPPHTEEPPSALKRQTFSHWNPRR